MLRSHDFRHCVAGQLDRAGLSAREIVDYLGHARISNTREGYMERGVVGERAGTAHGGRRRHGGSKTLGQRSASGCGSL